MSETAEVIQLHKGNGGRKDLYEVGEIPPLGHVPSKMYAWASGASATARPKRACRSRSCRRRRSTADDVLVVLVMAAGVNYNGVWAGLGKPISPFDVHKAEYHIAGSDAAGIVWAVGSKVKRWKVGDEVVVHCNQDDGDDEECNGGDPMFSPSQRIWGYETPDGSFAQFATRAGPPADAAAKHLTWEESACYMLTLATAYRMLFGHRPHILRPGHNVLIWGASGGLGSMAIQLSPPPAPTPSASSPTRASATSSCSSAPRASSTATTSIAGASCRRSNDSGGYDDYMKRCREFGKAIWDITGKGNDVDFVFEHPGEQTFPVSLLRREARRHGRVLRRHHRLQPHLRRALRVDAPEAHPGQPLRQPAAGEPGQPPRRRAPHRSLHVRGVCLGRHTRRAHTKMWKNQHKPGNMAVLVQAKRPGPAHPRRRDRGVGLETADERR